MSLRDFIKKVLGNPSNIQEKYCLGEIDDKQAEQIKNQTGLNVSGYNRIVDNFGLQHIIKKHGNEKDEASRGQIHVTPEDLEKIPEITSEPDEIKLLEKSKRGGVVIQFIKRIESLFFYNEEIRTGKKELAAKTMFKRK